MNRQGPRALDVPVWWVQEPEHYGKQLTDLLWQTGLSGFKLMSERMRQVLQDQGARLEVFDDVEIRLRNGSRLEGYVGVLEETGHPGPVHSLWRGRRSHRMVISEDVRAALLDARLTGLEFRQVDGPFPADRPGFFSD